jgi:3-oxoacyl-[acyl-carrier-protein] synthase-3
MIIQKRLGIGTDCLAFDVNLGCSAYPSGLQIVAALLQNTGGKGLLLVGDGRYEELPEKPEMDSLLFGDGAAATLIE